MGDIRSPRLLYLKAALFAVLGVLASVLLLAEHFSWLQAVLLAITIWAFCRAYYPKFLC